MFKSVARGLDALFVIAGALIAHWMRFSAPIALTDTERLLIAWQCALVLLLFPGFGVYEAWRGKSLAAMLARVLTALIVTSALGLVLVFTLHRMDAVSRLWYFSATLISAALITTTKLVVHLALRGVRRRGLNFRTVAIAGTPGFVRMLNALVEHAPQAGFKVTFVLDASMESTGANGTAMQMKALPVLTDIEAFADKVRKEKTSEVWLALPLSEERLINRFTRVFRDDFVNLRFIPDVRSLNLIDRSIVDLLGLPSISLNASPISPLQLWPKLVFDRLFAFVVLLALAPVFAVLAVAVKLGSPGPVFFSQWRKGADGRPFRIYKFRSMSVHREAHGQVTQASRHDARVTKVGALLRRTSLDELPQFFNVLLGQMSVVGPRPHAIEHDDLYKDLVYGYMHRYRIKPGITGWAQVNGYRGATTKVEKMESRVKFDLFYIHNWSFWFDIRIVAITIFKGFAGRNVY